MSVTMRVQIVVIGDVYSIYAVDEKGNEIKCGSFKAGNLYNIREKPKVCFSHCLNINIFWPFYVKFNLIF